MKKPELIMLKNLFQQELSRRNRFNELLSTQLIQEFLTLTNLDIPELSSTDTWSILEPILNKFKITVSNGILVCTGNYLHECNICYQETSYYTKEVSFDSQDTEYQLFKDIETNKIYQAYTDRHIQRLLAAEPKNSPAKNLTPREFCHTTYGRCLTSELKTKYTILNPYNFTKKNNGFKEVQKDFFLTAITKGQPTAKQLVLSKYPRIN